jgi:hypothetical protein
VSRVKRGAGRRGRLEAGLACRRAEAAECGETPDTEGLCVSDEWCSKGRLGDGGGEGRTDLVFGEAGGVGGEGRLVGVLAQEEQARGRGGEIFF